MPKQLTLNAVRITDIRRNFVFPPSTNPESLSVGYEVGIMNGGVFTSTYFASVTVQIGNSFPQTTQAVLLAIQQQEGLSPNDTFI